MNLINIYIYKKKSRYSTKGKYLLYCKLRFIYFVSVSITA